MITSGMDALSFDAVPQDLRRLKRWGLWRFVERDGDRSKCPFLITHARAKSNEPEAWALFEHAVMAYEGAPSQWQGLGFCFGPDDGLVGIDLDDCRDPVTGAIDEWAQQFITQFNTYSEISPSNTGVKLWCRGKLPIEGTGKKRAYQTGAVEAYQRGRFFCVTGRKLADAPSVVAECQQQLNALCAVVFPEQKREQLVQNDRVDQQHDIAIDERVKRARNYVAKMNPAIQGQGGSDDAIKVAATLIRGFDLPFEIAREIFANDYNPRCQPAWSDREIEHKLRDAEKYQGERGYLLNGHDHRLNGHGVGCRNGDKAAQATGELPRVRLPGADVTITACATLLGTLLGSTERFFIRGGVPMRMAKDDEGHPVLEPIRPAALCSDAEKVARLVKVTKDGDLVPTTCSETIARVLLECDAFKATLPPINVLSRCPVLTERGDQLLTVAGYDRPSGIFASGSVRDGMSTTESRKLLLELVADYRFATDGDKARAVAAIITPALVAGDLLGGRAPIDVGEADLSQTGKGYRNKITTAVYGCKPRMVTQRAGGVGSSLEIFDKILINGEPFVSWDNLRGKLDLPPLESFMTEDSHFARIPYGSPMLIDPRRFVIMLTSNRAEMTPDLANRSSCVRVLKQPDNYTFRTFPEGDLLDHVVANQADYLGAVFAIIREWHGRGKPQLATVEHDFRRWGRVLGWILKHLFDLGDLLEGHRDVQQRIASPGLTWARDVAFAVQAANRFDYWLRSHQLLAIIRDADVHTEGIEFDQLEDDREWLRATQIIGRRMGKLLKGGDEILIDNFLIRRREVPDEHFRPRIEFAFFPQTPVSPE